MSMVRALLAAMLVLATPAAAFYLPGVAPTDYSVGNPMNVKVSPPPPRFQGVCSLPRAEQ
jgi:hypothetical protein